MLYLYLHRKMITVVTGCLFAMILFFDMCYPKIEMLRKLDKKEMKLRRQIFLTETKILRTTKMQSKHTRNLRQIILNSQINERPFVSDARNLHQMISNPEMSEQTFIRDEMSRIAMNATRENVKLQSMVLRDEPPSFDRQTQRKLIHFVVQGSFISLHSFVMSLWENHSLLLLPHLSFQSQDDGSVVFEADVMANFNELPSSDILPIIQRDAIQKINARLRKKHDMVNPFCMKSLITNNDPAEIQQTSVNQIKMVGYLQQENIKEALVKLPSGQITSIRVGLSIGKENAHVSQIFADHTTLLLPSHQFVTIMKTKGIN